MIILFAFFCLCQTNIIAITRLNNQQTAANSCTAVGTNNQTIMGMGNCANNIYYINMQVGTPISGSQPQIMGLQFDTGSNIMWLPTQLIPFLSPVYQTGKSSTFQNTSQPGSIEYADGSGVQGTFGSDLININNTNITNLRISILWVTQQQKMDYPQSFIQGLVGMGFTSTPNFLDYAYSAGKIKTSAFTLQIMPQTFQSLLYINKIPQQILNNSQFIQVKGDTYWQGQIIGVNVGGIDMTSSAASLAVVDSGTSYFYLNNDLFNSVVNKYLSSCNNNNNVCPCNITWPTFSFMFPIVEVYIQSNQYIQQQPNGLCSYNFGTISTVSQILLGDIFFRGYNITFDKLNSQIGFQGNHTLVNNVFNNKQIKLTGYVMFVILVFILLIGIIAACMIKATSIQNNSKVFELSITNRSNGGNLKQFMV